MKSVNNSLGMTLVEVVFALMLFSAMAVSLMRMTNTTISYRKSITHNLRDFNRQQIHLSLMEKDLKNTFLVEDLNAMLHTGFKKSDKMSPLPFRQEGENLRNDNPSLFSDSFMPETATWTGGLKGTTDTLSLRTLSYVRSGENEKFSDQVSVLYYLRPCKNREKNKKDFSSCLWRKYSGDLYKELYTGKTDEADQKIRENVVLENVTHFQISYFHLRRREWASEWDTKDTGHLPLVVRFQLEFKSQKNRTIKQELNVPLYQRQISLKVQRAG